jgi:hypothetical protein
MTNADLLTKVEAALSALLDGNAQSYAIAGRALTRLSLEQLYKMRAELQQAVARDTAGGMFMASQFRNPE